MVLFHSYVKLPKGNLYLKRKIVWRISCVFEVDGLQFVPYSRYQYVTWFARTSQFKIGWDRHALNFNQHPCRLMDIFGCFLKVENLDMFNPKIWWLERRASSNIEKTRGFSHCFWQLSLTWTPTTNYSICWRFHCGEMLLCFCLAHSTCPLIGAACREPTSKCWPGPAFVEEWRSQAGVLAKALPRSGCALTPRVPMLQKAPGVAMLCKRLGPKKPVGMSP